MPARLLTFTGASIRDPAVEAWFGRPPAELRSTARKWFSVMRRCGSDVRELLHDGCPVACVQDAPFGYVDAFTSHVNVGFFHGAALRDPAAILQGTGRYMRHVKAKPGHAVAEAALEALVRAAYLDIRARLAARGSPGEPAAPTSRRGRSRS